MRSIQKLAEETLMQVTLLDNSLKQSRSQSVKSSSLHNIPIANWLKNRLARVNFDTSRFRLSQSVTVDNFGSVVDSLGDAEQSTIKKTVQTIHNLNIYLVPSFEQYL